MPCGKKPLVKLWDAPKNIRVVKPSRYQKNEASVKVHWKNVIKELENSYKDEKFWDSNCDQVRELVGPEVFSRLSKMFDLPLKAHPYEPPSDDVSEVLSSDYYYAIGGPAEVHAGLSEPSGISGSEYEETVEEEEAAEEEEITWTISDEEEELRKSRSKITSRQSVQVAMMSKSLSKIALSKSKTFSRSAIMKSMSKAVLKSKATTVDLQIDDAATLACSNDDLDVHFGSNLEKKGYRHGNPHYQMLYCNKSETDMIKWNSKYKQKKFEISASDEYSMKAELLTKQIALDFYTWWVSLGIVEFKSEIKRPEDIEDLFQVWFDEHASRGLKLDPKIIPCVLQSIADFTGEPLSACPSVLKRQIAWDIYAETTPAHTMAFNTCLPFKMKHIPPQNNTKQMWSYVKIPEDLKSFSAVWEEINHLTSTKAFQEYLEQRPHLPMPPFFKEEETDTGKQLFVIPSDYVVRRMSQTEQFDQELALPVSEFTLELKEVLSQLLGD